METEQFNIRIPRNLLRDLILIERLLKVSKSEWVKNKLAQTIYEEKKKLMVEISSLYTKGLIAKKDLQNILGKEIADEMDFIKKKNEDSIRIGIKHGREIKKKVRV